MQGKNSKMEEKTFISSIDELNRYSMAVWSNVIELKYTALKNELVEILERYSLSYTFNYSDGLLLTLGNSDVPSYSFRIEIIMSGNEDTNDIKELYPKLKYITASIRDSELFSSESSFPIVCYLSEQFAPMYSIPNTESRAVEMIPESSAADDTQQRKRYEYKGFDDKGNEVADYVMALSKADAQKLIHNKGHRVKTYADILEANETI